MSEIKPSHYINGQWHKGKGTAFSSINPSSLKPLWQGHAATHQETLYAMQAATTASMTWSQTTLDERIAYLNAFANCVTKRQEDLITLICNESGKPRWEAKTEVQAVIGKVAISIRAYQERMRPIDIDDNQTKSRVNYKAHGVIAVLGPFNFPAHLSNGHIVPALLAGNTIIYKPSELTPGVAAFITECWHDSQLPAGVFNLLQGDSQCAKWLLQQEVQGVFFTGSYRTGLLINQQMANRPEVILALEMGGNNPLIIDHLEDIQAAVYQTILSSFITAGQRCASARRIFIPNDTFGQTFLNTLLETTHRLVIGAPTLVDEPFHGPVIRPTHANKHLKAQEQLINQGALPLKAMRLIEPDSGFLTPGIIDMTSVEAPADEEIFAPLIQLYRYRSFEEAITLANQTKYGLAAGLLSDNTHHYDLFYQKIRAGLVYWNRAITGASSSLPFGGVGHSGNHRPSAFFAADYCAYPVAHTTQPKVTRPTDLLPGVTLR